MRLTYKHFIVLWSLLILIIGLLIFNAYSKLEPNTFISLLTEQVQKNYPGTKLKVEKIDYSLSLDFRLQLQNINLTRGSQTIGSLKEIELRVPWWLLVFNQGKAQINISDLDILIDNERRENKTSAAKEFKSEVKVNLPDYLIDAQYTLRAKNISLRDLRTSRRYFHASKLLVREFRYGKNSAFEVKLPIAIGHQKVSYTSELWLFGDVTPNPEEWHLNFRGEFRTKDSESAQQFEDIIIVGKTKFNPHKVDLSSNLALTVDKKEIGTGSFQLNEESYQLNFSFEDLPMGYLNLFEEELKNPYLAKIDGLGQGRLAIKKAFDNDVMELKGFLSFDGEFNYNNQQSISGKWRVGIDNTKWETSFISPQGEVSFFRRFAFNTDMDRPAQYTQELGFTGIDSKLALSTLPSLDVIKSSLNEHFNVKMTCKKCPLGEKFVETDVKYGSSPDLKFYQLQQNIEPENFIKINYQNLNAKNRLSVEAKHYPIQEGFSILEPYFKANEGMFDGKVEGDWKNSWEDGQWLIKLDVKNQKGMSGIFVDLVQKVWNQFTLDSLKVDDQTLSFSVRNGKLKFDSLVLEESDPAKMTGSLDLTLKQKSFLVLNYPKNKKWQPVKKEIVSQFWKGNENE